jgi:hypothetical protein
LRSRFDQHAAHPSRDEQASRTAKRASCRISHRARRIGRPRRDSVTSG